VVEVRLLKSPLAKGERVSIPRLRSLKEAGQKSILDKEDNGRKEIQKELITLHNATEAFYTFRV
jgi:hypothetical protein